MNEQPAPAAPALTDDDMPAAFRVADRVALDAQRHTLRWTACQLTMLVVAAIVAFIPTEIDDSVHLGALLSAAAFAVALVFSLRLAIERPISVWYEGRAGAESIKTLAWRYAVGGEPFVIDLDGRRADELFESRLSDVTHQLTEMQWGGGGGDQVSPAMRDLRARSLVERTEAYATSRVRDQQRWYDAKAEINRRRARRWALVGLTAGILGLVSALLRAALVFDPEIDPLSVFATIAIAVAAWIQVRQFQTLATSYGVAAQELATVAIRLPHMATEAEWAAFVRDAEAAISREHTLWRTRRAEIAV